VPFPLPLSPDVIAIQLALVDALHAQPSPADTVTLCGPPVAATLNAFVPTPRTHVAKS